MAETAGGSNDAVIIKVSNSGALQWVTQFGSNTVAPGGSNSGNDSCNSIKVKSGGVFCGGTTEGAMGEIKTGYQDAVVIKTDTDGVLQWITQLGLVTAAVGGDNSGQDICVDLKLDASGNIYCAGYTNGSMAETNAGGYVLGSGYDPFVLKLDSYGSLVWVKQLGLTSHLAGRTNFGDDLARGLALDSTGNLFVAGWTTSMGETNGGDQDAFVAKMKAN